jgi:hypothetical protein
MNGRLSFASLTLTLAACGTGPHDVAAQSSALVAVAADVDSGTPTGDPTGGGGGGDCRGFSAPSTATLLDYTNVVNLY